MSKKIISTRNVIIFILIALNTILLSSFFYKKTQSEPLALQVLNGCGEENVAADFAEKLCPFNVLRVDNADRFDIQLTRLEIHRQKVNHNLGPLQKTLNLPEGRTFISKNDTSLCNVTLIIGHDYPQILAGLKTGPMR